MDSQGNAGFKGELKIKVIRANPTIWQRIIDFLKGHS